MLCHALGREFELRWQHSLSDPSTTSTFFHDSIWFIWYYYLSVKFVMWTVKQTIVNKQNLLKKHRCRWVKRYTHNLWQDKGENEITGQNKKVRTEKGRQRAKRQENGLKKIGISFPDSRERTWNYFTTRNQFCAVLQHRKKYLGNKVKRFHEDEKNNSCWTQQQVEWLKPKLLKHLLQHRFRRNKTNTRHN